jgi:hypothetical protein
MAPLMELRKSLDFHIFRSGTATDRNRLNDCKCPGLIEFAVMARNERPSKKSRGTELTDHGIDVRDGSCNTGDGKSDVPAAFALAFVRRRNVAAAGRR